MNIYGLCLQLLATDRSAHDVNSGSRPNFHTVLQRVGKTVLRPGGTQGTKKLHSWCELGPDGTAIELSSGMGRGGVALAKSTGAHVTLTDIDADRLALVSQIACEQGVDLGLLDTMQLNLRNVDKELDDRHFDTAICEASLSHFPTKEKGAILEGLSKHADELLLHEICFRRNDVSPDELQRIKLDMSRSLAIGFHPLTIEGWTKLLDESGYEVKQIESGPIHLLNPAAIFQDEGPMRAAKIAWNIATNEDTRSRVLETRRTLKSHENDLGYILIQAFSIKSLGRHL